MIFDNEGFFSGSSYDEFKKALGRGVLVFRF